jgi:hypothetical protein
MKIAIYYDSVELAGAENLYINLARKFLIEGHEVLVFDNKKKLISKNAKGSIALNFDDELAYVDLLIHSMSDVLNVEARLNVGDIKKILVWNIHPDNIYGIMRFGFRLQKMFKSATVSSALIHLFNFTRIKKIKNLLKRDNVSVVFMDGQNKKKFTRLMGQEIQNKYLPIPFNITPFTSNASNNFRSESNKEFNLLMLGRLVDFKIRPLLNFIDKFGEGYGRLNVTVVGSGPMLSFINDYKLPANVKINVVGNKYGSDLFEYINKNDFAFAMGTAALDLAMCEIPVLLSPIGDECPGESCWLYQVVDCNTAYTSESPKLTWDHILNDLMCSRNEIVIKNRSHVLAHHNIDAIYKKIEDLMA